MTNPPLAAAATRSSIYLTIASPRRADPCHQEHESRSEANSGGRSRRRGGHRGPTSCYQKLRLPPHVCIILQPNFRLTTNRYAPPPRLWSWCYCSNWIANAAHYRAAVAREHMCECPMMSLLCVLANATCCKEPQPLLSGHSSRAALAWVVLCQLLARDRDH